MEPFPTMSHGFLTRGNMDDPNVAAEVAKISNTATIHCFPGWQGHEYHSGFPQQPIWKVDKLTCTDGKWVMNIASPYKSLIVIKYIDRTNVFLVKLVQFYTSQKWRKWKYRGEHSSVFNRFTSALASKSTGTVAGLCQAA